MKRAIEFAVSSWKTSVSGIIAAGAFYVSMHPQKFPDHPTLLMLSDFIAWGGLASLGLNAKDSDRGSNKAHEDMPKSLQGPPDEQANASGK